MSQIKHNKNCIIARNTGRGIYGRCGYCNIKLQQCFAFQANVLIFFIIVSIIILISIQRHYFMTAIGLTLIALLLVLAKVIDIKTDELALSEYNLLQLSEGLEKKVKERTKELERSNRLMGLFTDILRHDLLNPIGIIENITDILKEDKNLQDSSEIAVIKRNVKKLADIVYSASDYARLESVEKMERVELDISEVLENVIDDFAPYIKDKGIKVEFNPEGEYKTNASTMIESVFANILSNAIKYSSDGTKIKIAIEDDNGNWKVSFADQGEGILDMYKEAIFKRFTRKDKSGVKGTGLGLAIVKRIVEMHDGRVWIEDNPEGGSIFYVEIPK